MKANSSQIILYQTEDGKTHVEVQFAELQQDSAIKDFLITASDGKKYKTEIEELVFTDKSIKKKAVKIAKLLKA